MEKLEIKHLARRLPYGVKLYYKPKNICIDLEPSHFPKSWDLDIVSKPIFRPLSDLTKPISQANYNEGKEFVPIQEIKKLANVDFVELSGLWMLNTNRDGEVSINIMRRIDRLLLQWHFVINEPSGTWVDVNTLDNNPY